MEQVIGKPKKKTEEAKKESKYKLVQITNFKQLQFVQDQLTELMQLFIKKTGSPTNPTRILDLIINSLFNPYFRVYIITKEVYKVIGYYILQIGIDDDTFKPFTYVYQHCSKEGFIPEVNKQLEDILMKQGVELLKFITLRDGKSMQKSLGDGWAPAGTLFTKTLKKEEK